MSINKTPYIKKSFISQLSILITLVFVLMSAYTPSFAAIKAETEAALTIKMSAGSSQMNVNRTIIKIEKPYFLNNKLFIPLKEVLEVIGADVLNKTEGKVTVIYRDNIADITAGNPAILLNKQKCILSAAPVLKNKNIMVPVEFLNKFISSGLSVLASSKEVIIKLLDDGTLTDLSFLIGSIAQPKAGNSYFGWSMSIPKGSRIGSESFNTKYTDIENDQRALAIEVSVESIDEKKLQDKYNEMLEASENSVDEDLIDSAFYNKGISGSMPYAEFLFTGRYEEAIYMRIYSNSKYFYIVKMTSSDETDPEILRNEKYFKSLMDSFKLGYDGTTKEVANLSRIKNGFAEYDNYINSESAGKKIKTWSMSFLPEWDAISLSSDNPYSTVIGIDKSKYASVDLAVLTARESAKTYGAEMKKFYEDNFSSSLFKLISFENIDIAGTAAYRLLFEIKLGSKLYRYDERFIEDKGLVYDITFKTAEDKYDNEIKSFEKMLQSFKPLLKEEKDIKADIAKYKFNNDKRRISKEDTITKYVSKSGNWSLEIPGYWLQKSYTGKNMESFSNDDTGAAIIVETVDNKAGAAEKTDEEKFAIIKNTVSDGIKLKTTEKVTFKDMPVKIYKYRIEDDEVEDFADIVFYVFDKGSNSYCFMSTIQDLCASRKNINEIEAIWNSFTLIENTAQK